jgi:hypothetical protein
MEKVFFIPKEGTSPLRFKVKYFDFEIKVIYIEIPFRFEKNQKSTCGEF